MIFQRAVAMGAMLSVSSSNDFLSSVIPQLPYPKVAGALPVMTRELAPASRTLKPLDLVIVWGIGDYDDTYRCSNYYNPASPWYNVFFGLYAMRSYKTDGSGWGYGNNGKADFQEFLNEVVADDYKYFTAAQFGCPPELMSFTVKSIGTANSDNGWDVVDVTASVPSGLHDPTQHHADGGNYIVFGIPDPSFLNGHTSYEQVELAGRFYMRQAAVKSGTPPITLVWGAACPTKVAGGPALLDTIMTALKTTYVKLGS